MSKQLSINSARLISIYRKMCDEPQRVFTNYSLSPEENRMYVDTLIKLKLVEKVDGRKSTKALHGYRLLR